MSFGGARPALPPFGIPPPTEPRPTAPQPRAGPAPRKCGTTKAPTPAFRANPHSTCPGPGGAARPFASLSGLAHCSCNPLGGHLSCAELSKTKLISARLSCAARPQRLAAARFVGGRSAFRSSRKPSAAAGTWAVTWNCGARGRARGAWGAAAAAGAAGAGHLPATFPPPATFWLPSGYVPAATFPLPSRRARAARRPGPPGAPRALVMCPGSALRRAKLRAAHTHAAQCSTTTGQHACRVDFGGKRGTTWCL